MSSRNFVSPSRCADKPVSASSKRWPHRAELSHRTIRDRHPRTGARSRRRGLRSRSRPPGQPQQSVPGVRSRTAKSCCQLRFRLARAGLRRAQAGQIAIRYRRTEDLKSRGWSQYQRTRRIHPARRSTSGRRGTRCTSGSSCASTAPMRYRCSSDSSETDGSPPRSSIPFAQPGPQRDPREWSADCEAAASHHNGPDCKRIANGEMSNGGSARMSANMNPQVIARLRTSTNARGRPKSDS